MTFEETMKELESFGSEQTRKTYKRHGVNTEMFGVSYANLEKLRKKIKTDHALAEKLWASGNHDAKVLATMIADASLIDTKQLDAWSKELNNHVMTDGFAKLAGKSKHAQKKAEQWIKSKDELIASVGWSLIGMLAMGQNELDDAYFENHLSTVQDKIHMSKNRVRYSMNNALIGIGLRNNKLEKKALASAKKIGKVEVDHGETNCKTPDAAEYIAKAKQRGKQQTA